jgi:cellulose synthase/poly-beta-1,6-N-acetylglucosamine synthase-like glycosyltransferase
MSVWVWVAAASFGVLLWTWVLYPAAMWIMSRFWPPVPLPALREFPTVTAILATRDSAQATVERVEDFFRADYPADRLQVIVGIDGATPDRIDAVAKALGSCNAHVVCADAVGGKGGGLNAAVRHATGDVLVFSDVQQRFAPDAIRVLVARLQSDAALAAVGGALQLPGDRQDAGGRSPVEWYWFLERQLRAAEARIHSTVGLSGSIYAMWRREWQPMPDHLILDDVWLPMHLVLAKRRIGYELSAQAWDARSTSSAQEKARKVRTLTGNFQLMAWMPGVLIPGRNPIWVQFISHKVLRLLTPWMIMLLVCSAAILLTPYAWATLSTPVLMAAALTVGALLTLTPTRSAIVRLAVWIWALQLAVVEATRNGLRGRWDVWN